jgi:hypothetical protein
MATTRIDDPKTPPTDRYAIASPTGGGTENRPYFSNRATRLDVSHRFPPIAWISS